MIFNRYSGFIREVQEVRTQSLHLVSIKQTLPINMKRQSKELSTSDKPLGKRNAYNLFFKFHRLLLLQSLADRDNDNDNSTDINVSPDHWSHHHELVKDWKSTSVRPYDFPTFEKFMMYVLEIDLETSKSTYLKKLNRPHTKKHGLMNLHSMAKTIAQIWKSKKEEKLEIFQYYAELDHIRYEQDLVVYYSMLEKGKNIGYSSFDSPPAFEPELVVSAKKRKILSKEKKVEPKTINSFSRYAPDFSPEEVCLLIRLLL